ncbi:hypothetical protein EJD97_012339 [Solanum chilense]|uniref:Uncharacterized protein n=1 Tax=Solanum chilense TaxID=4083 RepID=A0A6N2CGR8_SOLCI|nr:hypothetical protein EJD97_012339 [Solanum chilense]
MVRRLHRSEVAVGRCGSLTKCGVTKCVTDRHSRDGPSCLFVVKIREVVPIPKFQKGLSVMERRPSTDRCAYDDPSYLLSRVMKKAAEEFEKVWEDRIHNGPS